MWLRFLSRYIFFPLLHSGIYFRLYLSINEDDMKQSIARLFKNEVTHEGFQLGSAIIMIVLFLTFWGVSFYVLLNSLA
jgi:hypothetical protein